MFHSFFQFPSKVQVLILLFAFFQFYSVVSRDSKVHNSASSLFFFFLIIIRSDCLVEIWRSVCISKSQRSLSVLFSRTDSGLCMLLLLLFPLLLPLLLLLLPLFRSLWAFHSFVTWWFFYWVGVSTSFPSLQNSSQYSSWSQQYWDLYDLDSYSNFQFFLAFGDCS